ncbi:MAG: alcohol dehydrogenase catalytic domain-containing protein [Anaerolineales bacterium]|nr:alcohol dehydrogenase catalytic domain-containing protein [Anaerolineales bacterium]
MRSLRLHHPASIEQNPLAIEEAPVPEPGEGQVLLQVKVCGVCHTDLHIAEGDIHPPSLPITPGHQVVGIVKAIGDSVTNIQLGDRIGIPWLYEACGFCEFCLRGQENLCRSARFTGFHVDGGFAEFMLAQAKFLLPIPSMITNEQAAPLLCAGIIGYRSLHQIDLHPGERLGLVGFGASAHLAIQVALYWGCQVYVFTRSKIHQQHAVE